MTHDFKLLAIKKETHDLAKQKAEKKGMYLHRYIQQLVIKDK
jgi:hypothetical protein